MKQQLIAYQPKNAQVQMSSHLYTDVKRGAGITPSETIPNNPKRGILPKPFYETNNILIPNPAETQQKKKTSGQYP